MSDLVGFRYPNAPIAEAVLEVRISELGEADFAAVMRLVDAQYPRRDETAFIGAEIESGPLGVATRATRTLNGVRLASDDGLQIVQLRNNGFAFSRLAPYEDWGTFYAEARRLWFLYLDSISDSVEPTRIALRFINQIAVPAGPVDIDDYLRTRPEISEDIPNATSGYFLSLDIELPMYEASVRITETVLGPNEEDQRTRLVLDIDVFREHIPSAFSADEMDAIFAKLRNAKNLVFEASITDNARSLFR